MVREKKEKIILYHEVNPGNNFYHYVNNDWLNKTHIPNYISSFSVNEEIEEYIDFKTSKSYWTSKNRPYMINQLRLRGFNNKWRKDWLRPLSRFRDKNYT